MSQPFISDPDIVKLALTKDRGALHNAADSTCTTGYDNDGSVGFDLFENGFELGRSIRKGQRVFIVEDDDEQEAWFFVGSKKSVMMTLNTLKDQVEDDGDE